MQNTVDPIATLEDLIAHVLKKDSLSTEESIRELFNFVLREPISSNKSFKMGTSIYLSKKEAHIALMRSMGGKDIDFKYRKKVNLNKDVILAVQENFPSPMAIKTDRLFVRRYVEDRVSTTNIISDQYEYLRQVKGLRCKDQLTIDVSKLSPQNYIRVKDVFFIKENEKYKTPTGNYKEIHYTNNLEKRELYVSITGVDGSYLLGKPIPSDLLEEAIDHF